MISKIKNTMVFLILIFTVSINAQKNKKKKKIKKDTTSIFNKVNELDEVIITGRKVSVITQIKQAPVSAEVIDLKPIAHKSGDLVNILNRVSGVTIRSEGAVGDQLNFSINGLDKKSIVLFKDGVPMSFYGHSFSPGLVSANMFERIEIYKGVLPIAFGADALGGGINFVTRQPNKKYFEVSSEMGSYATIRNAATLFLPFKNNTVYIGGNLAYTASDNNWEVEIDNAGSNNWAPLKNNEVNMLTGEFFAGIKNKSWVDDMRLTFIGNKFYRRINHIPGSGDTRHKAALALFTFGEEESSAGVFTYKKALFDNKLKVDVMAGISKNTTRLVDTTNADTDMFGKLIRFQYNPEYKPGNAYEGELAPSIAINSKLNFTLKNLRFNVNYNILKNHQLQFNRMFSETKRVGSDPVSLVQSLNPDSDSYGKYFDVYSVPAIHQKTITGFGLQSKFLNKKIQTLIAYKIYRRAAEGYSTYEKSIFKKNSVKEDNNSGYMAGISVKPLKGLLLKASYENTTRMPDDFEVFGYQPWFIRSNFELENENSINYNIQAQYTRPKWKISGSYFYRETDNKIFLRPEIPFFYHINVPDSFGILAHGYEMDFSIHPFSFMDIGFNAMYLQKRQKVLKLKGLPSEIKTGINKKFRFVDHPPILANADMSLYWSDVFSKEDRLDFYWYWNYIHQYKPRAFTITEREIFDEEPVEKGDIYGGDLDTHTAGVGYSFAKPKLSLSLECRNIADKIYYISNASGPRRTFSFKVRWQPKF